MSTTWKTALILTGTAMVVAAALGCGRKEAGPAANNRLSWHQSIAGAQLEARKRGTLILVDYHANRKGWLDEKEKQTLADKRVRTELKNFTLLRLNASEHYDPDERFGIEFFPTRLLLNAKGQVVARKSGYMTPDQYVQFLREGRMEEGRPVAASTEGAGGAPAETKKLPSWHKSPAAAKLEAKKRGALILVDMYGMRCPWCMKLEKHTFADPEVKAKLEDFTLLKVNASENRDFTRRYEVTGLPTTLILNANGKLITKLPGYLPPKDYLRFLDSVKRAQ